MGGSSSGHGCAVAWVASLATPRRTPRKYIKSRKKQLQRLLYSTLDVAIPPVSCVCVVGVVVVVVLSVLPERACRAVNATHPANQTKIMYKSP